MVNCALVPLQVGGTVTVWGALQEIYTPVCPDSLERDSSPGRPMTSDVTWHGTRGPLDEFGL